MKLKERKNVITTNRPIRPERKRKIITTGDLSEAYRGQQKEKQNEDTKETGKEG